MIEHIQPEGLFPSARFGFTHVVTSPPGKLVFVSGQVAWDRDLSLVLVVEVADSSLRKDLEVKVPLYSRAGVPEVWVSDINGRLVHRFTGPRDDSYSEGRPFTLGDELVVPESELLLPVVDIVG